MRGKSRAQHADASLLPALAFIRARHIALCCQANTGGTIVDGVSSLMAGITSGAMNLADLLDKTANPNTQGKLVAHVLLLLLLLVEPLFIAIFM